MGGGEVAAQVGLELTEALLQQLNKVPGGGPDSHPRQEQQRLQTQVREILTHTQQARDAHQAVIEAPQWSQPPTQPHANPQGDPTPPHAPATHATPTHQQATHPADVLELSRGGVEDNTNRPQQPPPPTHDEHIVQARQILAQLVPFLIQQEAVMATQAMQALDEWLTNRCGEPIYLIDTQTGEPPRTKYPHRTPSPGTPHHINHTPTPPTMHNTHRTHRHTTTTPVLEGTGKASLQRSSPRREVKRQKRGEREHMGDYNAAIPLYKITTREEEEHMKGRAAIRVTQQRRPERGHRVGDLKCDKSWIAPLSCPLLLVYNEESHNPWPGKVDERGKQLKQPCYVQ